MGDKETAGSSHVGVCLFGAGRAGSIHFRNLLVNPRARIMFLVDPDTAKAEALCAACGTQSITILHSDQVDQIYKDSRVAALMVCTPTCEHEHIVKKGLRHGKAVFCEKPISETATGITECYKVSSETGMPLLCSFNRRFDPSIRTIKERILAGDLGRLYTVKTCSRDHPLPPVEFLKVSGGMFHDCATHDIDMVCWLAGEDPCSVYVQVAAHDPDIAAMNDVDTVMILLRFPSSLMAAIDLSRHASYGYDQRVEVFGSKGMLQSENHVPNGLVFRGSTGAQSSCIKHSFPQRYAESYVAALEHFMDVVQGKSEVEVSGLDNLKCSLIATACEEAARTGLPVSLHLEQTEASCNGPAAGEPTKNT